MGHRENFKYTNKRNLQTDDEWSWQTVAGWKLRYNLDRFTFQKLTIKLSKYCVFEFLSWCSQVGLFKFVHKLLSSFKIRARISETGVRIFPFVFVNSYTNSCTNSYANSHVNFVHEIRTKFVIFDKFGKRSYEFVNVMLRMACTVSTKLYFVEIGWVRQQLHIFKCTMLKPLNSDFLDWEDTLIGKHLSIPRSQYYLCTSLIKVRVTMSTTDIILRW